MRKLSLTLLVVSAVYVSLGAADLTGVWTLDLDPDFGGVRDAVDCRFKQSGPKVTADCGAGSSISGEVNDQKVTLPEQREPNAITHPATSRSADDVYCCAASFSISVA